MDGETKGDGRKIRFCFWISIKGTEPLVVRGAGFWRDHYTEAHFVFWENCHGFWPHREEVMRYGWVPLPENGWWGQIGCRLEASGGVCGGVKRTLSSETQNIPLETLHCICLCCVLVGVDPVSPLVKSFSSSTGFTRKPRKSTKFIRKPGPVSC